MLFNPSRPDTQIQVAGIKSAARSVGRELVLGYASSMQQIDAAFASFAGRIRRGTAGRCRSIFHQPANTSYCARNSHGWPAIYQWREFAHAGGLASYGPNLFNPYRQAGLFAARILKGEKPSDLPVIQPTKFEFVINLRTAKALGLTIPSALLARADELIE